jgi:hypothetical protein
VRRAVVTSLGIGRDRQLAVVDVGTGRALTARREPKLLSPMEWHQPTSTPSSVVVAGLVLLRACKRRSTRVPAA